MCMWHDMERDGIYDHIDESIDNGDDFINKISNIKVKTNRLDLLSISHQMVTKDGWIYTLFVNAMMNADHISMMINDSSSVT